MSDFFDSEIVREEMEDIHQLQQEIYGQLMNINDLPTEEKKEHIEKLMDLLDKQRVMYARLSLSDDPKAIELKSQLQKSVVLMGFPENTDIRTLFDHMYDTIKSLEQFVDK
tara:strand:- start:94 stop:426 length:333 start_codon:yes stop_codon:yes gene_type:complete